MTKCSLGCVHGVSEWSLSTTATLTWRQSEVVCQEVAIMRGRECNITPVFFLEGYDIFLFIFFFHAYSLLCVYILFCNSSITKRVDL